MGVTTAVEEDDNVGLVKMINADSVVAAESTLVSVSPVELEVGVAVFGVALVPVVPDAVPLFPPRYVAEHLVEVVLSALDIPAVAVVAAAAVVVVELQVAVEVGSVTLVAGLRKTQSFGG
jgi:hypothetical protein